MIIQHSAATPEHYTPSDIIHAAWQVMGGIDLDPATTESVNRRLVGATKFYTKEDNGLQWPWHGRVWLNPPGGITEDRKSNAATWWDKLATEYDAGRVTEAIFLGFTLEILRSTQESIIWPGDLPLCIPSSRLDFLQEKEDGTFQRGGQPAHANVIVYLPPKDSLSRLASVRRFSDVFSRFGRVRC